MRRRREPEADAPIPAELERFDPRDWPRTPRDWPVEFGEHSYQRMQWHRARNLWRREQRPGRGES